MKIATKCHIMWNNLNIQFNNQPKTPKSSSLHMQGLFSVSSLISVISFCYELCINRHLFKWKSLRFDIFIHFKIVQHSYFAVHLNNTWQTHFFTCLPLGLVSEIYVKQGSLARKSKEVTRLTVAVVSWRFDCYCIVFIYLLRSNLFLKYN